MAMIQRFEDIQAWQGSERIGQDDLFNITTQG